MADLHEVTSAIVRRAERQGSILPQEIREELAHGNVPPSKWKQVVSLARGSLRHRDGRYFFRPKISARLRAEQQSQRAIQQSIRRLVRESKSARAQGERRQHGRSEFIQPVKIRLESGRELAHLCRDLSPAGIRLIGTTGLLGQKIEVRLAGAESGQPARFLVRILWTCTVGDGLFENGGTFLELLSSPESSEEESAKH